MKSKTEIAIQFKKHFKSSIRGLNKQYQNTRECQMFYAGDFMSYRDSIQFAGSDGSRKKAMVQFNRVKPYVNSVKGFMAQNRKKIKYIAKIEGAPLQELYTKYCNSLKDEIRNQANADQIETQQDGDLLVNGYGAVETAMTYGDGYSTTDPNGQIIMGRLDPLQVGWDPFATQTNLLDARWCFYQKDYALKDAVELFEDSDEEDFEPVGDQEMGNASDFKWFPRGGRYNKIKEGNVDWSDEKAEMVKVYFYQWYEIEKYYRANNPIYALKNPQSVQLAQIQLEAIASTAEQEDDKFAFDPRSEILNFDEKTKTKLVETFGEFIQPVSFNRRVYYMAVVSGEHTFTSYRSPSQDGFTIKFKTGDRDEKNKIWTGMVNPMKDPVMYHNKALTELMFTIGANSKGGVLVEKSAVDDIQEFEQKYAKTDGVIVVNDGAIANGKIRAKREPFATTGYEDIISLSSAAISDVNGIDKAFLGSSENKQETGILQSRRIRQVVSSLACYFDSVSLYQKSHAKLLLDLMRIYADNNDGRIFRMMGENGKDQFIKISSDKLIDDYDIVLEEAPLSPEDKQVAGQAISLIGDKMAMIDPNAARMLYAVALKYMPIDFDDQQKIMQIMLPKDQKIDPQYVAQLEQQVKALMADVTQADVKKKLSEIALNAAKTDQMAAATHKTLADANKSQQEAVQKGIENILLKTERTQEPSVVI